MAVHPLPSPEILERQAWQIPEKVNIAKSILMIFGLVWFGLQAPPQAQSASSTFSLMCSISSAEVPTLFEGGARATELESSGALVERPLEWVLPLPRPGMMEEDEL